MKDDGDVGSLLPTLGDKSSGAPIVASYYADTAMVHMRSDLYEV